MNLAFAVDALLYSRGRVPAAPLISILDTEQGPVRVLDTGGTAPAVVLVPDGPNVIEHYASLIERLRSTRRVVVFDLPGFGFSFPQAHYHHALAQGGSVILSVLGAVDLRDATLVCTCVNGFYAIAAAKLDTSRRIRRLVLCQTPSLTEMRAWTNRIVPKPIHVPVLGQLLQFSQRRKVADGWYHAALARKEDRPRFKAVAGKAFEQGACFCLASVVQGMLAESDTPDILQGVELPVTLIWGALDRSHKPTNPQALRALLPQADFKLWTECGHFPDLEDEAAFAKVILEDA